MAFGSFLLRTAVIAVALFALGFVEQQLLLGPDYATIPHTGRERITRSKADGQPRLPLALISCVVFSTAFVWMYSQGRSATPWMGQGLRFGAAVWAIASVRLYLAHYLTESWPGPIIAKVLAWEFIAALVLGLIIAGMAKDDGPARISSAEA